MTHTKRGFCLESVYCHANVEWSVMSHNYYTCSYQGIAPAVDQMNIMEEYGKECKRSEEIPLTFLHLTWRLIRGFFSFPL